jgi:hypothetical protein
MPRWSSRVAAQRVERVADHRRQAIEIADGVEPDLVVHDLGALVVEIVAQELHEPAHLVGGAGPVLRRERVERDGLEAELAGGPRDVADALGADAVALEPGLTADLRPAAVAVHDDAHVAWQGAHGEGREVSRAVAALQPSN